MKKQPESESEILKCSEDPYYYYVNYLCPEGKTPLTEEEFKDQVEKFKKEREKVVSKEELEEWRDKQAERTFKAREGIVDHVAKKLSKESQPVKNEMENKKANRDNKISLSRKRNRQAKKSRKNNRKK